MHLPELRHANCIYTVYFSVEYWSTDIKDFYILVFAGLQNVKDVSLFAKL